MFGMLQDESETTARGVSKKTKKGRPLSHERQNSTKKQNNQKGTNIIKVQQTTAIKLTVKM